jgi:hypothetical protein
MKTLIIALLLSSPAFAVPVSLTANFDTLNPDNIYGSTINDGGLHFATSSPFGVVRGMQASVLFGQQLVTGSALSVYNQGWVSISAPGNSIGSVTFQYGFDWNLYLIQMGVMDTTLEWEKWAGGQLVESGDFIRRAAGFDVTISDPTGFDVLRIRSVADLYEYLGTDAQGQVIRGALVGHGDLNHIAFDKVRVTGVDAAQAQFIAIATPDGGMTGLMLGFVLLGIGAFRRERL